MTTFIKTMFKISDDETNIDKYRSVANITEFHIISKLILQKIVIPEFTALQLKENIWLKLVHKQGNCT